MEMKYKVIVAIGAVTTAFAAGRFTTPVKVITEVKTITVEAKTENKEIEKNRKTHKKTTVVETTKPSGEKTVVTTITQDSGTDTNVKDSKEENKTTKEDKLHEVVKNSSALTVSALGGLDINTGKYVYGASACRPLIGPIAVGLWGMSNSTTGVSVGLQF